MITNEVATAFVKGRKRLELDVISAGHAASDGNWRGRVHGSKYSRLYFVLRGSFYIIGSSGERTELSAGGVYLVPSGYSYSFGCDGEMEHVYFHIRLADFDRLDLLERFEKPIRCPIETDVHAVVRLLRDEAIGALVGIECEIYRALAALAREHGSLLDRPRYSAEIAAAIDYISAHLSVRLTIAEVAAAAHLAPSTLTGRFRRETGMSVGEYVDSRIMLRAERALLSTDRSVLEISDSLGFCDQFYFSRRFKEKYGVCPREFRRQVNK